MRVSVIVPTYNRATCLELTLRSLVSQDAEKGSFEVIVCDDGSNGNEAINIVRKYEKNLTIQYFYQPDWGFRVARARNRGLALAEFEVAAFVDSGMILSSNCISSIINAYEQEKEIAIIGYAHGMEPYPISDSIAKNCIELEEPCVILTEQFIEEYPDIRIGMYEDFKFEFDRISAPWIYYWTAITTAPVSTSLAIGGFDENFTQWGNEDLDFAYRLHKRDVKFRIHPGVRGVHYPHEVTYERDTKPNWDQFYAKYKSIDLELKYSIKAKDYQKELDKIFQLSKVKQPYYDSILPTITKKLSFSSSLVTFGGLLFVEAAQNIHTVFDYSLERIISNGVKHSKIHFENALGTKTDFSDRYFNVSILGETVETLHPQVLKNMVKEATRIADICYFITTFELQELQEILRDMDLRELVVSENRKLIQISS
ncbi:glycosyltransferase involved in cell wall biosynthesis [Paenibacillus sp. DS2363]|uniref:glycosyltransferase n=1 Tax=Paenibacillus TaxID=44249 RepID=UPI00209E09B1|nr:glycosyltransferase [Paenibacillus xylanexedens]MCP1427470.1 glycosyltransferase involved in cell wall biosynthesis [Paenibacillus xylanexedens]